MTYLYAKDEDLDTASPSASVAEVPSASALQVLRRLGSIFTLVYAVVQKLKKDSWLELQFSLGDNSKLNIVYLPNRSLLKRVVSLLEGLQGGKNIALCQKE
ncbi:hypothetical protein Tco_1472077 [Tanacetum coccineum]